MGTRIQAIRRWWKDTPDPVRWVAYICLPLGALTLGLGVYGDGHGWWDHRGFLTNLMPSFTSLLFGVPTALFVLGGLGDAQNQARRSAAPLGGQSRGTAVRDRAHPRVQCRYRR
ncbi:hypothetical protein SAMN05428938_8132 [Streptomyces sp. KS_5]|nr:hypothetical protein SAMN05428938_8132 [Streptomyces sp. KS_5]